MMRNENEWISLYEKLLDQQEALVSENEELRDKYLCACETIIEKQEDKIALYQKILDTNEDLTRSLAEITSMFLNDPDVISDEFVEWFDEWLASDWYEDDSDDEWYE